MPVLIHTELHGLAGRANELRDVVRDHAERLARAEGCLAAQAYAPLGGEPGELVLDAWWRDEEALRAHYGSTEYAHYAGLVGELLARPSDATVHVVERSYHPSPDLSADPARQG